VPTPKIVQDGPVGRLNFQTAALRSGWGRRPRCQCQP